MNGWNEWRVGRHESLDDKHASTWESFARGWLRRLDAQSAPHGEVVAVIAAVFPKDVSVSLWAHGPTMTEALDKLEKVVDAATDKPPKALVCLLFHGRVMVHAEMKRCAP